MRRFVTNSETELIRGQVQSHSNLISSEIDLGIKSRILSLERMAKRWMISSGTPYNEWQNDAQSQLNDQPGYQAIEWVNSTFKVTWIEPIAGNEAAQDLDLAFEERRRVALEMARDGRMITVSRTIELVQGGKGFLVYIPIYIAANDNFDGFILGVYIVEDILNEILSDVDGLHFTIFDEETIIFSVGDEIVDSDLQLSANSVVDLFGVSWDIHVHPSEDWVLQQRSFLPNTLLILGIIGSALLSIAYFFTFETKVLGDALQTSLENVEGLARTDALTGLLNRRGILEYLERELSRDKRQHSLFSIVMLDLDGLKEINDQFGHNAGDTALKSVARALQGAKRDYDWFGRYGGDEFLGVFPNLSIPEISKLQNRIADQLKKINLEDNQNYSISLGWATYDEATNKDESMLDLIERADQKLYESKRLKKNNDE